MPCGKRPLVKVWDEPRSIRVVKPSRYQQNEPSVKLHWKKYMQDLELAYKDEQFWETQSHLVRDLVGPVIFQRLTKIFSLPRLDAPYRPESEPSSIISSEEYYVKSVPGMQRSSQFRQNLDSLSDSEETEEDEEIEEESSIDSSWSTSTKMDTSITADKIRRSKSKPISVKSKSKLSIPNRSQRSIGQSSHRARSMSKSMIMSRVFHRQVDKTFSSKYMFRVSEPSTMGTAHSADDVAVHARSHKERPQVQRLKDGLLYNPHFELLYCNESETDMIKWDSKYKKKTQEVSASEEYHNKAELLTKHIASEFYSWWISVGSSDYKSEIKSPEDLESLFQIWFDEHASRSLVLDPKLLPCVLQSIADYCGEPQASCPNALRRQIAWDIHAETSPAHTRAFNSSLPQKLKHIPPKNNTKETWKPVYIPEDLKSMSAVWGDIFHLTSTKAFLKWLQQRPYLPIPPCLEELEQPGDKKQLFVQPSDYILREQKSESIDNSLNIPISEFSLEIKDVISKMLQDN